MTKWVGVRGERGRSATIRRAAETGCIELNDAKGWTGSDVSWLVDVGKDLRRLSILTDDPVTGLEEVLAACSNLTHLSVDVCGRKRMELELTSPKLEYLGLYGVDVSGMATVASKLKTLDLCGYRSVPAFGCMPRLRALRCKQVGLQRLSELGDMPKLRLVELWFCRRLVDLRGRHARSLVKLIVGGCRKIDWRHLSTLGPLEEMYLSECDSIPSLAKLDTSKLRSAHLLATEIVDGALSSLASARRLRWLEIWPLLPHYDFGDADPESVRLEEPVLGDNGVFDIRA